mmetsp:Transcript_25906/g.22946  ORF Transcript_25906/g.22946 Transcript_25906/m.22946 type:complete len:100 (+) Transcript_25906:1675-1974(+)
MYEDKEVFKSLLNLCSSTSLRDIELSFLSIVEVYRFLDGIKENRSLKTVTLNVAEKKSFFFNKAIDLENSKLNLKIILKANGVIVYPKEKCPFDIIYPE